MLRNPTHRFMELNYHMHIKLAFTSIGLETNFRDLINKESRRPIYAFLTAQGFNVLVTLAIAYFLFK